LWSRERRRTLGRVLLALPDGIEVVPMQLPTYRMAVISQEHRVSTLGAEAVAAAEHLGATLCVGEGDDGPGIRSAAAVVGLSCVAVAR
jgi:hypothetical protein